MKAYFKSLMWQLANLLHKYISAPRMILGYLRYDGTFLPLTRVSNTLALSGYTNFMLENNVFIGHFNFIEASNGVTIGEGCQITNFVSILTHSSHVAIRLYGKEYIAQNGNHHGYIKGSVSIGKYTFIGPHCLIMPGTVLGKGSLIAAYSKVSGEFPDFAIVAGNPAVIVGDTRKIDQSWLEQYPELKAYYLDWTTAN